MRRRVGEIIEELKGAIADHDFKVSNEIIFQEAMTTFRGEQVNKPSVHTPSSTTITPKQKYFLEQNKDALIEGGFKLDNIKTKLEASKVIEAFKSQNG